MNDDFDILNDVTKLFPKIKYDERYVSIYIDLCKRTECLTKSEKIYLIKAEITKYQRKIDIIGMLSCYRLLRKVIKYEN